MGSDRHPSPSRYRIEAAAFVYEIVLVADALKEAHTFDHDTALHFGRRWQLLRAIERCGGAPTFTDLGRLLGMSRQAARELAIKEAETGVIEIFPAHDDRRAWQVMLTPIGRRALAAQRVPNATWLFTLLNGLDPAAMRMIQHVLRVIRLRLERYERELSRAAARR